MKEKTKDLINKVLGETEGKQLVGKVERETGKKFVTGKDIANECERFEHVIASEGEEAFMERVRGVVASRTSDGGDSKESTEDNNSPESDIKA